MTVGFVLVSVGMGYAQASGLPPIFGLYATIHLLFTHALFEPSRILVLGPDSALAALIAMGFFGPRLLLNGSVARAHIVYWAYVALWGIGIAPMVNRYLGVDPGMVMNAFLSASITFGAMSLWGYTSKRDLSGMGVMAGMALMGLFIAALVNMVVAMFIGFTGPALLISILISAGFVIFVSLITAWETQAIKEMYVESEGTT